MWQRGVFLVFGRFEIVWSLTASPFQLHLSVATSAAHLRPVNMRLTEQYQRSTVCFLSGHLPNVRTLSPSTRVSPPQDYDNNSTCFHDHSARTTCARGTPVVYCVLPTRTALLVLQSTTVVWTAQGFQWLCCLEMASCVDVEVGDGGKIIKIVYLDKPSNVCVSAADILLFVACCWVRRIL